MGVGGCGGEVFVLVTCSLQFAKAGSAATLSQQEKNNAADVQQKRANVNWLYLNSGKLVLAAMYLRRVRLVGRSFAAAPTHASTDGPRQ
jgi:hypothetical protein